MKKILIAGGAGFIGSHVTDRYIKEGLKAIVIDNLSSGKESNINKLAKFYKEDIRDFKKMKEIFEIEKPDYVSIHAAQKSVPTSVDNPIYDAKINILGFLNLLELSKNYHVKRVIFASTGGALAGNSDCLPSKEDDLPLLFSPYAISKFTAEKYLQFYNKEFGLNFIVLRYSNVYGPRQMKDGECGVIPIFMKNILNDKDSVLFTYEDMPKGCTRDYVYIEDVVEANVLALNNGNNEVINISSGIEYCILDIYNQIVGISGKNISISIKGPRQGDIKRSVISNERAKRRLKWLPKVDLIDGLSKTYNHLLNLDSNY